MWCPEDSQHDKRYAGRAEALMRYWYIEERAKVRTLMLDTRLAIEEWEMAVDFALSQSF